MRPHLLRRFFPALPKVATVGYWTPLRVRSARVIRPDPRSCLVVTAKRPSNLPSTFLAMEPLT